MNWKNLLEVNNFALNTNLTGGDVDSTVQSALVLGFSGLVLAFVGVIIYAGILWTTAGDSEERLAKAKNVIKNGGLAIGLAFGFLFVLGIIAAILGIDVLNFTFLSGWF